MVDTDFSRRSLLKAAGATAATAAGGAAVVNTAAAGSTSGWTEVTSPVSKTLYGVSMTVDGPYAAGKDGNLLSKAGGSWEKTISSGPHTRNNSLNALAVTDDGKRLWFAGSSGSLGAYDVTEKRKYDYTAPGGKTSTWEAITLTGKRDQETIHVANGSGEVLKGVHDADGCVKWEQNGSLDVTKPGGGSTIPAIDFRETDTSVGHAVDTSQGVYETTDGGESWTKVGIANSQVSYYDNISFTAKDGTESVFVVGGGGKGYRLDCTCDTWTPVQISDKTLQGVDHHTGSRVAVGNSGRIHEKPEGNDWQDLTSPVNSNLYEVAYGGADYNDVVVGSGGVILER